MLTSLGLGLGLRGGVDRRAAGEEVLCGKECMDRAAFAQMLIVGVILAVILAAGLCCAASLDSPDRFETPKERRD